MVDHLPSISDTITELAYAKLNLTLQVTGRREDGYHLLDSLVVFADVADVVHAHPAEAWALDVAGPFAGSVPVNDDNLILRAGHLLAEQAGVTTPAALQLDKQLPVGAGLGGGSADAAAVLRALNRLWSLDYSIAQLAELALPLGADVPVCCWQRPMHMRGIGEILSPIACDEAWYALLVYPALHNSTADIFNAFTLPAPGRLMEVPVAITLDAVLDGANDLEAVAAELNPAIDRLLEKIAAQPDCVLARMSGSGSACFGLFEQQKAADDAAAFLMELYPNYWICSTGLITA